MVRQADYGERTAHAVLRRAAVRASSGVASPFTAGRNLSYHVAAAMVLVTSSATKPRPHKLARPVDHAQIDFMCFRSFVLHRLTNSPPIYVFLLSTLRAV